jgi:hypothetical protein
MLDPPYVPISVNKVIQKHGAASAEAEPWGQPIP